MNPNTIKYNRVNTNPINLNEQKELLFDLNRREKEYQRVKEKEKYRRELLNQIEDNERRKKEKKKELEEENKLNEINNMKYFMYKQKQEEEFERIKKLNNNKRMKSQFSHINQEYFISDYNLNEKNLKEKEKEKSIKTLKREEREKEEITNNYNKIARMNYFNMFEAKEELKDYINKEFDDFLYTLDDETENDKNRKFIKNINVELSGNNSQFQNENKRYNIHKDKVHKNADKENKLNYDKISDVNEMIKSYKIEMRPSINFNPEIDNLLNSYSNMIIYKSDGDTNYINKKINKLTNDIKNYEKEHIPMKDIDKKKPKSNISNDIKTTNNEVALKETSNENIGEEKNEEDYKNYLIF